MRKTPIKAVEECYKRALDIVDRQSSVNPLGSSNDQPLSPDARAIAASNLAVVLSSYELEQQALQSTEEAPGDDDMG